MTPRGVDIVAVDHTQQAVARRLHAVQMSAYAQEARLLGAVWFPPLERSVEDIAGGHERFTAAFVGDELAGAIGIEPDPEALGLTIASLVVAPPFQRRGIARALMAQLLAEHGHGVLTVQTGARNAPALALYTACGFGELRRWFAGREPLELVKLLRPVP